MFEFAFLIVRFFGYYSVGIHWGWVPMFVCLAGEVLLHLYQGHHRSFGPESADIFFAKFILFIAGFAGVWGAYRFETAIITTVILGVICLGEIVYS